MKNDSKTLLKKSVSETEGTSVERTRYSVIAGRMVAMGGTCSNNIYAQKFNEKDYLIIDYTNLDDEKNPVAIVNENYTEIVVLSRMYEEAKKVAGLRAKLDDNSVLDLTGNVEIPEEAKYYR